jgi:hypothetical protein
MTYEQGNKIIELLKQILGELVEHHQEVSKSL